MNTFFHVLSNLKHDGDLHVAGSFFQAEAGAFADLVEAGVLRVVEGAENEEAARKVIEAEAAKTVADAEAAEELAPKNTWEAQKPDAPAPADEAQAAAPSDAEQAAPAAVVGTGDVDPGATGDNL